MNLHDESRLADHRSAFLRHLPRRVDVIGRRLHRFLQSGWDINGLSRMHDEARRLGEDSARFDMAAPGEHLLALADMLQESLTQEALPDPTQGERLLNLMDAVSAATPKPPEAPIAAMPRHGATSLRAETPPLTYWRRWADDAPPASYVESSATPVATPATTSTTEEYDFWGNEAPRYGRTPAAGPAVASTAASADSTRAAIAPSITPSLTPTPPRAAAPAPAPAKVAAARMAPPAEPPAATFAPPAGYRVYHLTGHGELSLALDQRLEALGVEVELLEDADELRELLGALPADLVLVDAEFSDHLDVIGEVTRQSRQRSLRPILLVAFSGAEDITLRLIARRAGVDTLLVAPASVDEVLGKLQAMIDPGRGSPYRILIVEDDRSQALFAEGILRNSGMDSLVVLDALGVLPALEQFQPDLILMDLNMPDANGIELTALIREQPAFAGTPIVFLSGESDEDRQFDALDAGGDDFLTKPIRPRHLISAVQSRVRRHRSQLERRAPARIERDPMTGLLERSAVVEQIGTLLAQGAPEIGGVLFLEIEGITLLRDRLGLTALEQVLVEVGRLITDLGEGAPACRFGDGSYLLLSTSLDDISLEALAMQMRSRLVQHAFRAQNHPLRLRVSVGVCALRHGFSDAGALLNAAEKATREARTSERGVRRYEPPKASEAQREAVLLGQLRQAIDGHNLELLYQPVVAVAGSDESQYQVLLRLRDAQGKLRSAAEIVPMAERGDFIVDIDRWVLLQALALIRDHQADGQSLRLFITQSPLTLADSHQAEWLKSELLAHGVPGTSLVIEIRLEDAAVHGATVQQFCTAMVADGVQFCLSQFEAGPEANALLDQLPLGFIKLARKYTSGAITPALRDELKILIERAHRHGFEVIGHGVEDAQAAATLWMSGIDFIQGNLVQQANEDMAFDFNQAVL